MKFKKSFLAMLALILVFATMFTLSSCKKNKDDHEHSYESVTTPATCTTEGVITYTCSCGDTYTEAIPVAGHTMAAVTAKAATCTEDGYTAHSVCSVCGHIEGKETVTADHSYSSKITTYPTTTTGGVRTNTCTVCGHSETVNINAITFEAPDFTQMIANFIGENQYTLNIDEDSTVIYTRELSDYQGSTGQKSFLTISIAEATISGKEGALYGHIKLEMTGFKAIIDSEETDVGAIEFDEDEAESVALYLYVNGSALSVEVTNPDGTKSEIDEDINEYIVQAILSAYVPGGSEDDITVLAYTLEQIANAALPLIEHAFDVIAGADTPTVSEDYLNDLAALGALIGENIIEAQTVGADTVYTLNIEAIGAILDEIEGKTVAEYLTEVYGEDVLDMLADFFKALPDKTAREIADAAFAFADAAGVSVEDLFTTIEVFVYNAAEIEFSIYEFIEENADKTLADFLAEASGAEAEDIKSSITTTVDNIYALTVEELLSLVFTGDVTSADTIIATIKSSLTAIEGAIAAQLTYNAEGVLTAADIIWAGFEINASFGTDSVSVAITPPTGMPISVTHTSTGEDSGTIEYSFGSDDSIVIAYSANGITVVGYDGEYKILDGAIIATEEGTTTTIEGNLVFDGDDYLDLTAVATDGQITSLTYIIRDYVEVRDGYYDEDYNWVGSVTRTFETLLTFTYTDNGDSETITILGGDDDSIIITGTDNSITIVGYDGEDKILDAWLTITDDGTTSVLAGDLVFDEDDYFDLYAVSAEGQITNFEFTIRGYVDEYDGHYDEDNNWIDSVITVFKVIVDYSYTDNGDSETILLTIEDVDFTIVHELVEDMDVISATGSVDGVVEFESEIRVTDEMFYCEMGDGDNTLYRAGIAVDEVTGEITALIYMINAYYYDYDEFGNPIKTLYNVFGIEYVAATDEDPAIIAVGMNDVTLTTEIEETENGVLISVSNGERVIGTIELGYAEGVYTFAVDFDGIAEGAVSIGAGNIDVDIDHLTIGTEDVYDYVWVDNGHIAYYEQIFLYTVFKYIEADFGISFTIS